MKEKNKPKCKEWERRRREKLNEAFNSLVQLLPSYDPAKNLAKIDILERATDFVKDLRLSNSRLVSHQVETDEKCKLIKQLQDEVNKLILRVKQLTTLLKTANIPIPLGPSIECLGKRKLKWSGKCTEENLSAEKVSDEENSIKNVEIEDSGANECRPNDPTTTSSSSSTPLKEINGPAQDSASPSKKLDDKKSTPPTPKKLKLSTKLKTPNKSIPTKRKVSGSSPKKAVTASTNVEQSNASSPNKSPPQQQPVVTNACLLPNGTMIPLMTNSPITAVFTEPPKSTTATMLPLQTIFVTSNVMQNVHQPVITRIALGQNHSFMSPGLEANSIPGFLPKIPITMIRKPVPKIKFKRRHKKKILQAETATPIADSAISIQNSTKDNTIIPSVEVQEAAPVVEIEEKQKSSNEKKIAESEAEANKNVQNSEPITEKVVESETMTPSRTIFQSNPPPMEKPCSTNSSELMQIQLFAHEPDQEIMEVDQSTSLVDAPSPASVLCELKSRTEQSDSNECSDKSNDKLNEPSTIDGKISNTTSHENISHEINKEDSSVSTTDISTSHKVTSKVRFDQALADMNPSPTNHQENISPPNETVSGDKISECISRSMDLIDAPDGELMELGDNWGDPTNSPKSPISPTQMFLSMFPLLPKDNVVSTPEGHNIMTNHPRQGYNSQTQHRSFYIDSMLPEDNSVPVSQIGHNNRHSTQTFGYRALAVEPEKPYSKPPKNTPEILTTSSSSTSSKVSATNVQPVSAPMTLPQRASEITTTKTTKPVVSEKPCEMPTISSTPKSVQESGSRRSHSYSGGQQSFKEFNLFSDSLDFSALHHSLPFTGMTDQDLFRGGENSRSRGLFDAVFPLNIDHSNAVPSSSADQHYNLQQHFDVQENIQNIQFQLNRDRHHGSIGGESTTRLENLPPVGESYSNNFTYPTIPRTNLMSKLPSTSSQITSTSQHNNTATISQGNATSFNYSATISTPPKATAAKISPSTTPSQSTRQLFRPQVHDMMGNHQSSSTTTTTSTQPYGSKRPTASTVEGPIVEKVVNSSSQAQRNVDYFLFQKSSQQPPTTTKPSLSSSEKRKSSAASQRKPRNTTTRDANSFDGPSISSSTSRKERNQKDRSTSKESNKKSTASGAKHPAPICEPIQNFNQFPPQNLHHQPNQSLQTSPRRNIATSSHTQDIFAPLPPTNLFGHSTSNQQTFDHNLNIFAEFPLPVDCNPHYDHYSMDFSNFSTTTGTNSSQIQQFQQPLINTNPTATTGTLHEPRNNIPHQQQHHHNQQQQQPLITHPHNNTSQIQHTPSNSRSSRPTPFYLQDVNCDNYNSFEISSNPPSHSQQSHQMHTSSNPPPSANPQAQTAPSIHSGHHHYGNVPTVPPPRSQPPPQQTVANLNHQNQYFQTPLQPQQQQSQPHQCQQVSSYPTNNNLRQGQPAPTNQQVNNNSNNSSGGVLSNSRNVQIQQQIQNSSSEHQQIMQHSHHYTHSSQTQVKPTKPSSSSVVTSSVVSNNNNNNTQSSLAQQQPGYASTNINARVLPPPNVTSSHRPVNWMTDNNQTASSTTPLHNPFTIGSNSKPSNTPTAITNPFSVSKLVGSSSSNSPSNIKPQPHPHTLSRQNSSSNYCAEALIRKNPSTSTPNLSSSTQSGWGSSLSLQKTQHNYNFFQPASSSSTSSSNVHQFNAQHQTQTSQQHTNPYTTTTNFNDNFSSATSGYSFHSNPNPTPHSHPHPQNYEPLFENNTPSRNTHQQQQNLHNFQHPQTHQSHHIHHLHNNTAQQGLSHSQQGTSSVSNFNLSTIFPEINDKRQHQVQQQRNSSIPSSGTTGSLSNSTPVGATSSNSQNRASTNSSGGSNNMANLVRGTSSNNNNSNCGYYAQQQQPTGQGRTK